MTLRTLIGLVAVGYIFLAVIWLDIVRTYRQMKREFKRK